MGIDGSGPIEEHVPVGDATRRAGIDVLLESAANAFLETLLLCAAPTVAGLLLTDWWIYFVLWGSFGFLAFASIRRGSTVVRWIWAAVLMHHAYTWINLRFVPNWISIIVAAIFALLAVRTAVSPNLKAHELIREMAKSGHTTLESRVQDGDWNHRA